MVTDVIFALSMVVVWYGVMNWCDSIVVAVGADGPWKRERATGFDR